MTTGTSTQPAARSAAPKRHTISVTLPDGNVATRSTRAAYTHAVIVSPEDPAKVKEKALTAITETLRTITDLREALGADNLRIHADNRVQDRDPDTDPSGRPSYTGFVYTACSNDGRRPLASIHGNSREQVRGLYGSDGSYTGGVIADVRTALGNLLELSLTERLDKLKEDQETVSAIEAGTFDAGPWTAHGYSSSESGARKTAWRDETRYPTRKLRVVPVDR